MLLYGIRATKTSHQNLYGVKCAHCDAQGSMEMNTYSKYAHILRIPLFPVKNMVVTQCNRCRQVLSKRKFSDELLEKFSEMKKPLFTIPLWHFTGAILFSIIVAMGVYKSLKNSSSNDVTFTNRPQTGGLHK